MWLHPATQRNLATLAADGVRFVGPDEGAMACGEFGPGRMAEPEAIFAAITAALDGGGAAPTEPARRQACADHRRPHRRADRSGAGAHQPLQRQAGLRHRRRPGGSGRAGDPGVRSSRVPTPAGVTRVDIETAEEMLAACGAALPADAAVCVAAVADWRPDEVFGVKLKKSREGPPTIRLVENPDILATLAAHGPGRPKLVVGFAAETSDLEAHARAKLKRKGCDWIVANDVSADGIMGGDENEVLLVYPQGTEAWAKASKVEVARRLAARIAEDLA